MLRFTSLFVLALMLGALDPLGAGDASGRPSREGYARGGRGDAAKRDDALAGETIDFEYDGADVKNKARAYTGRVFVHEQARGKADLPLVVFIHGLNRELIPHRWMGGGKEGDVRRIVSDLIESGAIPPVILAGPGSVQKDAVAYGSSFPQFDLDKFLELVDASLEGRARIDRTRIIVTGHSGAGCSDKGGIVAATSSKQRPYAIVSIDTCMHGALAEALGHAHPDTHVVVTWQTASWDRNFKHFEEVFSKTTAENAPHAGILRELDNLPAQPLAHDATVGQTYAKWLPRLLPKR